jgi:hypothetical protein
MLACDRIGILPAFSSGKVVAMLRTCLVFLTGYTCYENQQSSCRVDLSAGVLILFVCLSSRLVVRIDLGKTRNQVHSTNTRIACGQRIPNSRVGPVHPTTIARRSMS